MREIKFRGWDKRNNKWFHRDLIILTNAAFYPSYTELEKGDSLFDYEYKIMQYAGLKDKNGKEIYEGDIVSFDLYGNGEIEIGTIIFSKASFVAQTDYSPALDGTHHGRSLTYQLGSLIRNDKNVEVIGNIYENPDLLE